ncbi:MAG: hypothetical protein LBS71_02095, partial [Puniceicoccales bacterium]|nr:hypothetical protein [Puniceicoccales bacterium]
MKVISGAVMLSSCILQSVSCYASSGSENSGINSSFEGSSFDGGLDSEENSSSDSDGFGQSIESKNSEALLNSWRKKLRERWKSFLNENANDEKKVCDINEQINSCKCCLNIEEAVQFSHLIENFENVCRFYFPDNIWTEKDPEESFPLMKNFPEVLELRKRYLSNDMQLSSRKSGEDKINDGIDEADRDGMDETDQMTQMQNEFAQELFKSFLLDKSVSNVRFQSLKVKTDDITLNPVVYYPELIAADQKLPCVVWLHGGGIGKFSSMMYITAPNSIKIERSMYMTFFLNATYGLQPLARFLVANDVVFATITFDSKG